MLLVRDPWWLYAYWEVTPEQRSRVIEKMRSESRTPDKTVIRVYDVTDSTTTDSANYFDIELNFFADNWYIDVGKPDRAWVMEIGLRTRDGYFYPLVRSNTVRTPRHTISDVLDEEWLLPDDLYWKIYGLPADGRKSSADLREFLDKYLRQVGSSENVPAKQAASPPSEKR